MTAATLPECGFVRGMDERTYHRLDRLSSSGIVDLLDCPSLYRYYRDVPEARKDSDATELGRAIHAYVLEGEAAFLERFYVTPHGFSRAKKADKETAEREEAAGRSQIKEESYDQVRRINDAIRAHPLAAQILDAAEERELTAVWDHYGVPAKARFDIDATTQLGLIADLKTTADPNPRRWERNGGALGRAIQNVWYSAGYLAASAAEDRTCDPALAWVIAPTEPPYTGRVWVAEAGPRWLEVARREIEKATATYRRCVATNTWEGYSRDAVVRLDAPPVWLEDERETA